MDVLFLDIRKLGLLIKDFVIVILNGIEKPNSNDSINIEE